MIEDLLNSLYYRIVGVEWILPIFIMATGMSGHYNHYNMTTINLWSFSFYMDMYHMFNFMESMIMVSNIPA